jgi:ribosomal protein L18
MTETLEFTTENFSKLARQVIELEAELDRVKTQNLTAEVDKQKLLWGMENAKATASHIGLETAEQIIEAAKKYVAYIDQGLMEAEAARSVMQ